MKNKIRIAGYGKNLMEMELIKEYIKDYYPEHNTEIEFFIDEGLSGATIDKPNFQKMLKAGKEKPYDIIIVCKRNVISRSIDVFCNVISELNKFNTRLVAIEEEFDSLSDLGKERIYILKVFDQIQRREMVKRNNRKCK